ncbi:hypothetical protein [Demequina sp.]|uniref:hypothetical protein n=1 Tax=Demequina sp. TaxID=2050685 RepID=UPI0025B9FE3E|nr:hypothetical protein [Demequina sp.]
MNQTALKYGAPALASVNLVPKEIAERKTMRAVRLVAIVALLVTLGVVALGYLTALGVKAVAQRELDDAATEQYSTLVKRDKMVPVYFDYVEREQQELALAQAGWAEVSYSDLAFAFANTATGATSSFESISLTGPNAVGVPGPSGDLLVGNGVGLVMFEARASSPAQASELIARMEAVPGIAGVRASSESFTGVSGEIYWRISGTAVITETALTNRFLTEDVLGGLDVLSLVTIPSAAELEAAEDAQAEEPSPSTEPSAEGEG